MIQVVDLVERLGEARSTPLARIWRRVGRRADGRPPLWIELLIVAWLFWLYDVINNFAPVRERLAFANAAALFRFERSLGLDPELTLNRWLAAHHGLAGLASYYYFFAHGVLTFVALGLLWWRAPALYRRLRTPLVTVNLIAFIVFWRYPLAPPRSFPGLGFSDVLANANAMISWHSGVLVHDADQYAAMPSLHVAWAIWTAIAVWGLTRRRVLRALALVYPLLTALVVLATANHYLLDVLAGAATTGASFALQLAARRLHALVARRRGARERAVRPLPARPEQPA
jgi:hypothetical protein